MDLTPPQPDPNAREPEAGIRSGDDAESPSPSPGATAAAEVGPGAGGSADPHPDANADVAWSATPPTPFPGSAAAREAQPDDRPRIGPEIGGRKFRVGTADEYVPFRNRTRRRRRFIAATALAVLVLGAAGYGAFTLLTSDGGTKATASCPARAVAVKAAGDSGAALLNAAQITLNVYNSTDRPGLAAATASQLKQRGFVIGKVANDPLNAHVQVAAQIRGSSREAQSMRVVAAEVSGAQMTTDQRTDASVDLVLGAAFNGLSTPNQVANALSAAVVSQTKTNHACS